jgi:DNA-binding LytR/AlgR family response regulator
MTISARVLIHPSESERIPVDPSDVYLLEADGSATRVRRRSRDVLLDYRELGQVFPLFEAHGFLRVHREFAVNPERIAVIRRRRSGRDWELKLEPPVNRVIPIARDARAAVWGAFGEPD